MSENGQDKRETLANIVAEMRMEVGYGKDTYCGKRVIRRMEDVRVMQFCDRIEAAWKRDEERAIEHATHHAESVARDNCRDCINNPNGKNYEPVGNAAATRKALINIQEYAKALDAGDLNVLAILYTCRAALSEPPRQCDVGTAEEQMKRFDEFTSKYWPLGMLALQWAQTPYEERKGAGE